jgi:hypothetical protein
MKNSNNYNGASGGAVYGLGFIGALIYFIGHAATFWMGALGYYKQWYGLLSCLLRIKGINGIINPKS